MRTFVIEAGLLPDLPGMMLVTINALKEMGGSGTIQEIDEKVTELEGVSEEEQSLEMSNSDPRSRLNYYLAWTRTYLKRGGAIENSSRGVWALTEVGKSLTAVAEMKAIYEQVQLEERERAKRKREESKKSTTKSAVQSELGLNLEEAADEKNSSIEEPWTERLLRVLRGLEPSAFERLAQRLLRESGFTKVEVTGKVGDGGIDGVGVLRVNLVSFQVFFQCKRYKGSVGASDIRDFRGAMVGRADKGLFITTGSFTAQASDEATRDGAPAIDLIDGQRLCELLKENQLGIRTEMIERVEINREWFESI
ncbi:MAG: restriction endonuclease [Pseudomonadota bacterium]